MQINKLNSNASNNIRIRKNSRSKSKEVPPSDSKVGSKIVSPNI